MVKGTIGVNVTDLDHTGDFARINDGHDEGKSEKEGDGSNGIEMPETDNVDLDSTINSSTLDVDSDDHEEEAKSAPDLKQTGIPDKTGTTNAMESVDACCEELLIQNSSNNGVPSGPESEAQVFTPMCVDVEVEVLEPENEFVAASNGDEVKKQSTKETSVIPLDVNTEKSFSEPKAKIVTSQVSSQSDDSDEETYSRLDRYGFLTGDNSNMARHASMSAVSLARNRQSLSTAHESEKSRRRRVRLENLRLEKWLFMSKNLKQEMTSRPKRFKRRIRKGIPDAYRLKAWSVICGASEDQSLNPSLFQKLLQQAKTTKDPDLIRVHDSIYRDVGRTFPRHVIFKHKNGVGQQSLANVLKAYSMLDTEVGYCQGMGFVVGLLLGYLREEDTFWILKTLMSKPPWNLSELYKPGMPGSQLLLYQFEHLLKHFVPDVASHLERENIVPSMYATQWFITVFAYNFPFDIVVRIWDIFLYEGWKIVFRVAITIIRDRRKEILSRDFEKILEYFRGIPPTLETDKVLQAAYKLKLKTSQLEDIASTFQAQ